MSIKCETKVELRCSLVVNNVPLNKTVEMTVSKYLKVR